MGTVSGPGPCPLRTHWLITASQPKHQDSLRREHPAIRTDTQTPGIGKCLNGKSDCRLAHVNAWQQSEDLPYPAVILWGKGRDRAPVLLESYALICWEGIAVPREHSEAQPASAVCWPSSRPTSAKVRYRPAPRREISPLCVASWTSEHLGTCSGSFFPGRIADVFKLPHQWATEPGAATYRALGCLWKLICSQHAPLPLCSKCMDFESHH